MLFTMKEKRSITQRAIIIGFVEITGKMLIIMNRLK